MADPLYKFSNMPLNQLEEIIYALQIHYDPPLRVEDRKKVLSELKWIIDNEDKFNEDDIRENRRAKRERDGKQCDQEISVTMGTDLLLLADHQLIFFPVDNGYYCYTRYEVENYILVKKVNPYNNERLSEKELNLFRKLIEEKPYPNIEVYEITTEIDERLRDKVFEVKRSEKRILTDKLVNLIEEKLKDYKTGIIYRFIDELSVEEYNSFLMHRDLNQKLNDNISRDNAATQTLGYILNKFDNLNNSNRKEEANLFLLSIAFAIDEYLYMISNKLSYQQLLEEKGKIVSGNVKELYWKPSFIKEKYYDSGEIYSRVTLNEEGKKEGVYEKYHENGNLFVRVNYVNGKKEGKYTQYLDDGNILYESTYYNGELEGEYKVYYSNGKLKNVGRHHNGSYEGEYIEYYPNGELKLVFNFKNGKLDGISTLYSETSSLLSKMKYNNGILNGISRYYDEDGNLPIVHYSVPLNGVEEIYYSNDKIKSRGNYINSVHDGVFEVFYPNGNLKIVENYVMGVLQGKRSEYYENGDIKIEENYIYDLHNGSYTEYYPGNRIKLTRNYSNGYIIGIEEEYNENGELANTINHGNEENIISEDNEYYQGDKYSDIYIEEGEYEEGEYEEGEYEEGEYEEGEYEEGEYEEGEYEEGEYEEE